MVEDGEVLPAGLLSEGAGEPALADAARTGDEQIAVLPDPVAGGELEEERSVEAAGGAEVDVLDGGAVAKLGRLEARLEALLTAGRHLVVEDQAEPFGVAEVVGFGGAGEGPEAPGHAVEAKPVEQVERGMVQHECSPFSGSSRIRGCWDE